ncbi:hypothetical protein GCM10010156_33330 [Planobispora rosea]|uniref:VCBS repeat-containing protein n=1 Tax=Planobispora rosea TaxID=35762 RepID=A0A8J3WF20_PLARO|nr:FG-GAP-like repeat-containing protein [Planobispora rosea]GGS71719.1 hypothetical protein GCM10010156_33330 [Planobispora rosea]GIH85516.1 hypothetical protein Pro02_39240 [Planobispora rosea]
MRLVWGGAGGPVTDGVSPAVPVPDIESITEEWPAAGDVDGDGEDDLVFRNGRRVELLTEGPSAKRELGPFSCPADGFTHYAEPVRAGDYDRDGRDEVLISCWSHHGEPDPRRWWMWDANGPMIDLDTSGFVS